MLRNDRSKVLVKNGRRRHGQDDWHTAECEIEDYGYSKGLHRIWCATHGQWAHETPVETQVVFEDGRVFPIKF